MTKNPNRYIINKIYWQLQMFPLPIQIGSRETQQTQVCFNVIVYLLYSKLRFKSFKPVQLTINTSRIGFVI